MTSQMFRYIFGIAFLVAILTSCTETIDIELDETYTRLVIDGQITTDTMAHALRLSKSASYFSNTEPPVVSGAEILLDDGFQQILLTEMPSGSGAYFTPEDYHGIPGRSYSLQINLSEEIGESLNFLAQNTMAETQYSLDSIGLEYREPFGFWMVMLYAYDPPTTDFYRLDAFRNGVILTDTAYRTSISDDRLFNGNNTNGSTVMFLYEDEVQLGDTISLRMGAISKAYYDFLFELRNESGFSNPLFGGPPANIKSNLQEDGLGFFGTMKTARTDLIITEEILEQKRE